MLNSFPSLLVYTFFAPTLLRVAAAVTLACVARIVMRERKKIEQVSLPIIGHATDWMCLLSALVTFGVAVALFVGWETQWAAILGMIIAAKHFFLSHKLESIRPLPRSTYALLLVMCLSLVLTGAGAFAFDLPL